MNTQQYQANSNTSDKPRKAKTQYPQGRMLVTRECMKAICLDNSPANTLLSVLMYWYDHSPNEAINGLFTVVRTQAALVTDACNEITEKTLHDVATPFLQLLGFLDVEEYAGGNRYTLHIDIIHTALKLWEEHRDQLEIFLIKHLQLEKFLIKHEEVVNPEKFLINKKKFQSQLEKVLIANRKSSNCQRGPKPSPQGSSRPKRRKTENKREFSETITENEENSDPPASPSANDSLNHSSVFLENSHEEISPDPDPQSGNVSSAEPDVISCTNAQPFLPDPAAKGCASSDPGGDSTVSRLRIAPHVEKSPPSMPIVPDLTVSPPQGHKTDNSDTDDTTPAAVNSTEVDETIESLDQLRFWLRKLRIYGSSDPVKKAADLSAILPCVRSKADLEALIARADAVLYARYGEHKQIFVGNVADQAAQSSQSPREAPPVEESYAPSPEGMDTVKRDEVLDGLWEWCPDFVVGQRAQGCKWFIAVFWGDGDWDFFELGKSEDWQRVPQDLVTAAEIYGAKQRQQGHADSALQAVGM